MRLGYASPSRMLREMTRQEWLDWQIYLSVEPAPGDKADVHNAALIREIRNALRDTKKRSEPFTLEECLIRFGDDLPPPPKRADWRKIKKTLLQFVGEYQKKDAGRRRKA